MKKKNTLNVKPLRRYNTPVYPSYLDKNPIEHPDTLPYPFTYKALQALAAAGILVGASCAPTEKVSGNTPNIPSDVAEQSSSVNLPIIENSDEPDAQQQDSPVNPFTFEYLGVPFMPASFGTGLPSRLRSEEARTTINKVFEEEGIQLTKDYFYKKDSIAVALDGFNPDLNIGYVWVNWDNMGEGMIEDYFGTTQHSDIIHIPAFYYTLKYIYRLENLVQERIEYEKHVEKFHKPFEEIKKTAASEEKLSALKEMYLDMVINIKIKGNNRGSKSYCQNVSPESSFEEKKRAYYNDLLIDRVKSASTHIENRTVIIQIADSILRIEDREETKRQYKNLMEFLDINKKEYYNKIENGPTKKILAIKDEKTLTKEIQAFGFHHLDKKLTLKEAQFLENTRGTGDDFIAPISVRDYRFSYQESYGFPELTPEQEKKLMELREKQGEHEYMKAFTEVINSDEIKDPKDEALKALETQVRQYIQWAKQQGGY